MIDRKRIRKALGAQWFITRDCGRTVFLNGATNQAAMVDRIDPYVDEAPCELIHASICGFDALPSYDDLKGLHRAVWGDGYAYQCFVPDEFHVNIHEHALHLWGAADGRPLLPEFSRVMPDGSRSI